MDPQKPNAGTDRYPDADGAAVRTRAGEVWLRRDGILHLVGFPEMDHDAGVAREVIETQVRAAGGTKRLRSSPKHSLAHTPIIAITANALKGDAEKALEAGCDVYMSKPINVHELRARVEAFVPSSK